MYWFHINSFSAHLPTHAVCNLLVKVCDWSLFVSAQHVGCMLLALAQFTLTKCNFSFTSTLA